jgi:hypothetical protein
MAERHMGVRELARLVPCNSGYISKLRSGQKRPSAQVAARVDDFLSAGGRLAALAAQEAPAARQQVALRAGPAGGAGLLAGSADVPGSRAADAGGLRIDIGELVMAAAYESGDQAAAEGSKKVPSLGIDQLRAEVRQLALGYNEVPPLAFLAESRRTRDLALRMTERTRRPAQLAELYLAAGQVCALMSVASFDLAVWNATVEQAHAASVYAEMIGHRSLQAWALGMQALTAYWCGRTRDAVDLADAGLALAPQGTARARLHSISARAWSHVGAEHQTRTALGLADEARDATGEAGDDELHDALGGEFGWGPARQAMSSATALLQIGDPGRAAIRAREAIRLRPQDSTGSQVSMTARADLACAELAHGRLDAADDALRPVWEVAPAYRRHALVERLCGVAVALGEPRFASAPITVTLAGRIEAFTADSAPRSLPPSHGPDTVPLPGSE